MKLVKELFLWGVIVGMVALFFNEYYGRIFRDDVVIELDSLHQDTAMFLHNVDNLFQSSLSFASNNSVWRAVEKGKVTVKEGGVFFKIVFPDGQKKTGVLEIDKNTKHVMLN